MLATDRRVFDNRHNGSRDLNCFAQLDDAFAELVEHPGLMEAMRDIDGIEFLYAGSENMAQYLGETHENTSDIRRFFSFLKGVDSEHFPLENYVEKKEELVVNSILDFVRDFIGRKYIPRVKEHINEYVESDAFRRHRRKLWWRYSLYEASQHT